MTYPYTSDLFKTTGAEYLKLGLLKFNVIEIIVHCKEK